MTAVVWSVPVTVMGYDQLKRGVYARRRWRMEHRPSRKTVSATPEIEATRKATAQHDRVEDYVLECLITGKYENGILTVRVPLDDWPQTPDDCGMECTEWPWPDVFLMDHVVSHLREVPLTLMVTVMADIEDFERAKLLLTVVDSAKVAVERADGS